MFLTSNVRFICDAFLTLLYPQTCAICEGSVERHQLGVACEACWSDTLLFTGDETVCWKCGTPSFATIDEHRRRDVRCHRCDPFAFAAARACGLYEKALRETVLFLKRQPSVPHRVLKSLTEIALREPLRGSSIIVPVPLHAARLKARGFNQAAVISNSLSRRLRLPVNDISLIRISHSDKYRAGLDVQGRSETVSSAFEVVHPRLVSGERILLVDDVLTTGATADACSGVLMKAGAEVVNVLTLARTAR